MEANVEQIARKKIRNILESRGLGYIEKSNYDSEHEYLQDLFREAQEILDSKYLELKNSLYFVKKFEDAYGNEYELINVLEDEYAPEMHFDYQTKIENKIINVTFEVKFSFEVDKQERFVKNLRGYVKFDEYVVKMLDVA